MRNVTLISCSGLLLNSICYVENLIIRPVLIIMTICHFDEILDPILANIIRLYWLLIFVFDWFLKINFRSNLQKWQSLKILSSRQSEASIHTLKLIICINFIFIKFDSEPARAVSGQWIHEHLFICVMGKMKL